MDSNAKIKCPSCDQKFKPWEMIGNPSLEPLGMRIDEEDPKFNFYLFRHNRPECGTSLAVMVELFRDWLDEPVPVDIITGSEPCELRCIDLDNHGECSQNCTWAPYRRLLTKLLDQYQRAVTSRAVTT
ncbi:MAG: hypothetical protein ABIE70_09545 [bacterium]